MIYVDELQYWGKISPLGKTCHMTGDSKNELLEFAKIIGLPLQWFQKHKIKGLCHFDLTKRWRDIAIQNGAIEMEAKEMLKRIRK